MTYREGTNEDPEDMPNEAGSAPNPWLRVLEFALTGQLGDRAEYFDMPRVAKDVVSRLGFLDPTEIDPLVLEEILDRNRKSV